VAALAIVGVFGVLLVTASAGIHAPAAADPPKFSARASIRALQGRPAMRTALLGQGFYGGGLIAAVPLYALVHVDRLDLKLTDVGVIGILAAVSTTVSFPIWGAVADRHGGLWSLRLGSTLGVLGLIGYALAPHVAVLWVMAVGYGAASAAIDVGIASVVSDQTPLASRAAAMAGWNAITGARGIAAAFLMSALLQLGIVDVTSGLLVCAVSSAVGVVMFARVNPNAPEPEAEGTPEPASRQVPARSPAVPSA
jgi:MFS family permease